MDDFEFNLSGEWRDGEPEPEKPINVAVYSDGSTCRYTIHPYWYGNFVDWVADRWSVIGNDMDPKVETAEEYLERIGVQVWEMPPSGNDDKPNEE